MSMLNMFSTLSKVFETEELLFEHINDHIQNKFLKHHTGFRTDRSMQKGLLVMTEK